MKRIGTGKLREQNDKQVFAYLAGGKAVTKRELANATGLTFATIGNILNDFVTRNIVIFKESLLSKKGRPTITYTLNPDYFHGLSLIITVINKQVFLCFRRSDALLRVLESKQEKLDLSKIDHLLTKVAKLVDQDPLIKVIGLGVPSVIYNDEIIESDIPELKGLNLKQLIEDKVNIPTYVKNEMNYCAYGFYWQSGDYKDVCYVTFPNQSGPGCGSVINGKILEGHNNIAGEIIYLPFFEYLQHHDPKNISYDENKIALALSCLASIINPAYLVITGESLTTIDIELVKGICLKYIPEQFMAELVYRDTYLDDFFNGILKFINEKYFSIY